MTEYYLDGIKVTPANSLCLFAHYLNMAVLLFECLEHAPETRGDLVHILTNDQPIGAPASIAFYDRLCRLHGEADNDNSSI